MTGAEQFLVNVAGFAHATRRATSADRPNKIATIDYDYNPGAFAFDERSPRVRFDGEDTVTEKRWPVLAGYHPKPGDRVLMIPVGRAGYVIAGTVGIVQGPEREVFTESGTWYKPDGAVTVRVQVQGGGGAGGGAAATGGSQTSAGSGGQGGGYAETLFSAHELDDEVAVTVGSGGSGASGAGGGSGGTSSFGSVVSAAGGDGGGTAGASGTPGGISGGGISAQSLTGELTIDGEGGMSGARLGTAGAFSGSGGSSVLGGGARSGGVVAGSSTPTEGRGFGGGGGGGANGPSESATTGGAGADGVVIVTSWFS